ncbi:hypothetical protein B0H21DRAFT_747375 [Amylocystis lapponica]|nr:hypothetical protein B0H21DRAFT_747375 [Amylocystis lapponica]
MSSVFQNAFYIAINVGGILYGVELMLYFQTMRILYRNRRRLGRTDQAFALFSTATLILITVYEATEAVFGQETWIVNANFPGGPAAYQAVYDSAWYQTMGSTATVMLDLLTDGLLIYRCYIVWNSYRIIAFPCFLWIATLALGIVELYTSGSPNSNLFDGLAQDIGLAYFSTTIGLNVLVTGLICGRILWFARNVHVSLGRSVAHTYIGVIALIVESALPFSLFGIAFLVSYGLNSEISIFFLTCYVMFTCISPQMLILRQAEEAVSTLVFPPRPQENRVSANPRFDDSEGTAFSLRNVARSDISVDMDKV